MSAPDPAAGAGPAPASPTSGPSTSTSAAATLPDGSSSAIPGKRFLVVNSIALGLGLVALVVAIALPRSAADSGVPTPGGSNPVPNVRAPGTPAGSTPTPGSTFAAPLWDDGKAEVSRYNVREPLYKKISQFERVRIVARELYDPRSRTKANGPGAGIVDSIKQVDVDDVPTGSKYSFRQTLALRVLRSEPARLVEASLGTQDWSGNMFVLVTPRGDDVLRHVHSYWETEGDRDEVLPAGTVLEDELPLTLRAGDFSVGTTREIPLLLPTIVTSRQPATQPRPGKLSIQGEDTLNLTTGVAAAIRVRLDRADGVFTTYWFARSEPHICLKWMGSDGHEGLLTSTTRDMYWRDDPNKPCDCEAEIK